MIVILPKHSSSINKAARHTSLEDIKRENVTDVTICDKASILIVTDNTHAIVLKNREGSHGMIIPIEDVILWVTPHF